MTCESKLREDLKEALKLQDKERASILRMLLSEIKNAEIAQRKPLDDDQVLGVISKAVKQHRESIEAFKQGNRDDLVAQEKAELSTLMKYLPKQMSHEEIKTAAQRVIETVEVRGMKSKGNVMAQLMPQLKGKADGKEVSEIVSELLATA